jgi:hypothetical protein
MTTLAPDRPFVQVPGNIVSDMDGEKVMLNVSSGKYFNLGQVGGRIWELLVEPASVSQLVETLTEEYDVMPEQCAYQVSSYMKLLLKEQLIQPHAD